MKAKHTIVISAALLLFLLVYTSHPLAAQTNVQKSRTQSELEEKEKEKEKAHKHKHDHKADDKAHDHQHDKDKDKERKDKKEDKDKDKDKVKEEKKDKYEGKEKDDDKDHEGHAHGKEKEFKGQGHAYGRNKGGLSGKEFGQRRAEEARGKAKENIDTSKIKMGITETTIQSSSEKIAVAKTKIESDYKAGKLNPEVYEKTKAQLEAAEQKVRTLLNEAIKLKERIENTTKGQKQP